MKEFVIFEADALWFALPSEKVFRIIMPQSATPLPNAPKHIEGVIEFEHATLKVLNFRHLIGSKTYEEELLLLFEALKKQHVEWVESLKESVRLNIAFEKPTNANECQLGKWLNEFTSYDDYVVEVMKHLIRHHSQLHKSAITILQTAKNDKESALKMIDVQVQETFDITMNYLTQFINKLPSIANSLQKLIVIHENNKRYALKIDKIIEIDRIDEAQINYELDAQHVNTHLKLHGVIEFQETLVSVIHSIEI